MKNFHAALAFVLLTSCQFITDLTSSASGSEEPYRVSVPIGGNAWIKNSKGGKITENGLAEWTDPSSVVESYIRFARKGKAKISLKVNVNGSSKIRLIIAGKPREIAIYGNGEKTVNTGEWDIPDKGYVKISMQGLTKSGETYCDLKEFILQGGAVNEQTAFVKDNADEYFHWGRRGPSVHLRYVMPENEEVEWFYNEVAVPEGQDVIGSYFMANGFAEGYFGMQVNSEEERRILFSVWSPFQTDDPKSIPKDMQIKMLGKGKDVHVGEFGDEGSGGQSYLNYNWKAGNTYRFLLRGIPAGGNSTIYTAYFFAPEEGQWRLIASFKRPKTSTYLKHFHSFLENFIPETGDVSREVSFGNQWVRNSSEKWTELTQAKFTADNTARKGFRMDYAGGKDKELFFLKNCGFFNDYTKIDETFTRQASGRQPDIDFEAINRLSAGISQQP